MAVQVASGEGLAIEGFEKVVGLALGFDAFDRALRDAIGEDRPDLRAERREIARAVNQAIRMGEGRYLLLINPDTVVRP